MDDVTFVWFKSSNSIELDRTEVKLLIKPLKIRSYFSHVVARLNGVGIFGLRPPIYLYFGLSLFYNGRSKKWFCRLLMELKCC